MKPLRKILDLKADIGHYGGTYVDVPKTEVKSFRSMFGRTFPRGRRERLSDNEKDSFFFADRSKGQLKLDELERKGKLKLRFPELSD